MRRSKSTLALLMLSVDHNGIQDQLTGDPYTVLDASIGRIFSLALDESILFGSAQSYGLKFTRIGASMACLLCYKRGEQMTRCVLPLGEARIKASVMMGIIVSHLEIHSWSE